MNLPDKRGALRGLSIARGAAEQLERQQVVRIEAGIHVLERDEAANHQAAAAEQHERKRHFGNHNAVAHHAGASQARGAAAAAQHVHQVRPGRTQGRGQAEDRDGRQARQCRENLVHFYVRETFRTVLQRYRH